MSDINYQGIADSLGNDTPKVGASDKGPIDYQAIANEEIKPGNTLPSLGSSSLNIDLDSYNGYVSDVRPLEDINLERAMNQPWTHQAARAGAQMFGEIVGGTIEGLGSIPELAVAAADEANKRNADFDNVIIEFGRNLREGIAEATPIYRTNPNATFDVMDSGWWFSHMPSVASSLSMLIPAKAATSGLSLLNKIAKAGKLGKAGKAASTMSAGARYVTKLGVGAAVSRNAENFRESYQVYDEIYNEALNALQDPERATELADSQMAEDAKGYYGKDNLSPQELAEYTASRASWRSYRINSANIVFDAIQFAPLLKLSKASTRTGLLGRSKKILEAQGKWDKLSRVQKLGTYMTPGASVVATQFTEGIEEGINFIGGEEGKYLGRQLLGGEKSSLNNRMKQYVTDGHFYESAAWGVLGGVAHSAVAGAISKDAGPQSTQSKIGAIKARNMLLGNLGTQVKEIEQDVKLNDAQKSSKIQSLKESALYNIGMLEAQTGTVDLLLEYLDGEEFKTWAQSEQSGLKSEEVTGSITEFKNIIRNAENIYKKHSGAMFYSNASQQAQKLVEQNLINNEVNVNLKKQKLSEEDNAIKEYEKDLNLTEETKKALNALSLRDAIAIANDQRAEAQRQGNKDLENTYKKISDDLQNRYSKLENASSLKNLSVPAPLIDKYAVRALQESDINVLQNEAAQLTSEKAVAEAEKVVKEKAANEGKQAKEAILKLIKDADRLGNDLTVLARHSDPDIKKAAENKIAELKAKGGQAEVKSKSAEASEVADNLKKEEPAPEGPGSAFEVAPAPLVEGQVADGQPAGPIAEGQVNDLDGLDSNSPNLDGLDNGSPFNQEDLEGSGNPNFPFARKKRPEDVTEDVPTGTEEGNTIKNKRVKELRATINRKLGTLKRSNIKQATADRLENEIAALEAELTEMLASSEVPQQPVAEPQTPEEFPDAVNPDITAVELAERIQGLELDIYTFGKNLKDLLQISETTGNVIAGGKISAEQSNQLSALYNLRAGDKLTVTPNPDGDGYVIKNEDQQIVGNLYSVQTSQNRLNQVQNDLNNATSDERIERLIILEDREKSRLAVAERMQEIFDKGAAEITTEVTATTPGAIILTDTQVVLNDAVDGMLSKHGIAIASTGIATSLLTGEKVFQDGETNQSIVAGKKYIFIDAVGGTIAVPITMPTIKEAGKKEILDADLKELVNFVQSTNGQQLAGTPEFDAIINRLKKYATVGGTTGIRVVNQNGFINLKLPTLKGDIEVTLINKNGEVLSIGDQRNVKYNGKSGIINTTFDNAVDLFSDKFIDIDKEVFESGDETAIKNYLQEIGSLATTNVGSFQSPDGTKHHVSPFSLGGYYGASVQQEAVSHTVTKPAPLERVSAVKKASASKEVIAKAKKKAKNPKKKKGKGAFDAMDDMINLNLIATEDANNDGKREDLDAAEAWWRKTFKNVPFIRVEGLINNGGELAYGMFANASVTLSNMAIPGTAYHEGFHVAMHLYLTEAQRNELYSEARKELGKMTGIKFNLAMESARVKGVKNASELTDLQVEEYLAEKFRSFMITNESEYTPKTVVGKWFKKLKDLIRTFLSKPGHADKLFQRIKSGDFNYQPTERMIAYAKGIQAPLAVEGLSVRETRESVNILTRLMHGAIKQVQQEAKAEDLAADTNLSEAVEEKLSDYLQYKLIDNGIGNVENIQKAYNAFSDTDLSEGLYSRTVRAYKMRYGVDLSTATLSSLSRVNIVEATAEESDVEINNDNAQDGMIERNWGDSFWFHNPKNSISQEVRNTLLNLPKIASFEGSNLVGAKNNFFGIAEFAEFNEIYPYLESHLSGINSVEEMVSRIYEFANSADPTYMALHKKLTAENGANLRSAFFTHFSKQRPEISMGVYEDGDFKMLPVNRNNSELLIRERFVLQGNAERAKLTLDTKADRNKKRASIVKPLKNYTGLTNQEFAKRYSEVLGNMGMSLIENGIDVVEKALSRELDKGTLTKDNLYNRVGDLATAFVEDRINAAGENEMANLKRFGKAIRYYKSQAIQNVIQNVEGKNLYGVTQANHVSRVLNILKEPGKEHQARVLLGEMLKDPRVQHSNYIRLFVKFGTVDANNNLKESAVSQEPLLENGLPVLNKEGIDKINYSLLDGLKTDKGGVRYGDMSEIEYIALSTSSFLRGSTDQNNATITTPALTPSDKGTIYLMNTPRWQMTSEFADGSEARLSTVLIKRALHGEMSMMRQEAIRMFGDSVDSTNLVAVEGAPMQTYFNTDASGNVLNKEGKPVGGVFTSQLFAGLDIESLSEADRQTISKAFNTNGIPISGFKSVLPALSKIIKREIIAKEASILTDKIEQAANKSPHLKQQLNAIPGRTLKDKAATVASGNSKSIGLALHNYLHNYEMQVLFYGTEAEFKNDVDHGKRAASPWTPGIALDVARFSKPHYTVATLQDIKVASASYDTMVENLTMNLEETEGITAVDARKKAVKILAPYKNIETTDAQGYMTLDRFGEIMRARGMGDKYDSLIAKIKEGKTLKPRELQYFIDPVKPFYYDRSYNESLNRMSTNLIKLSSLPLIPQLTKGTELDKLRLWMEGEGGQSRVDEVVYQTAHKVGSYNVGKAHKTSEGNVTFNAEGLDQSIRTLPHTGYTIQLDNPEHLIDAKAKLGSQLAKLIVEGLYDGVTYGGLSKQEFLNKYQSTVSQLVQQAHDSLMEDLGATLDSDGNFVLSDEGFDKFAEVLANELERRDAAEVLKAGLKTKHYGGKRKFVVPAFFSGASSKVESMMLSLFTNRITNIKVPGGTAVQASSSLMVGKNTPRLSVEFNDDGSINHYQVLLPAYMKKQMTDSDGKVLSLKRIQEENPEILEMIGYRIPTEGKNSMAPLKVVGFLPAEYGGTIIVPDEFIVQMGSDFDIDKLFLQMRNPGKELSNTEQLQNELFNMIQTVLQHPNHMKDVVTPQGYEGLKKEANKIAELRGKSTSRLNTLLLSTQNEFRSRNSIGSSMIGIAANMNVFAAVAQNTGMSLKNPIKVEHTVTKELKAAYPNQVSKSAKIGSKVVINHKNLANNEVGNFLNADGVNIMSELKQFIAATVDNAKDPIFDKFNGKAYTVPTILTMVMAGVPTRTALLLAAQPSIVEAAAAYDNNRSIFGTGSTTELREIKESYYKKILKVVSDQSKVDPGLKITKRDSIENLISKLVGQGQILPPKGVNADVLQRSISVNPSTLENSKQLQYYAQQLFYLDQFQDIRRSSMAVQDSVKVYKTDINGAGPTTSSTHQVNHLLNAMDTNPLVFIGDVPAHVAVYPSRAQPTEEYKIPAKSAYPILESYYQNVNVRSIQMAQQFFLAENSNNLSYVTALMNQINNNRWDDRIAAKAKRLVNQTALTKVPALQDLDAAVLMGINAVPANGLNWTREEVLSGAAPVANSLLYVLDNYKDLADSPFHILNKLKPILGEQALQDNYGMKLIAFNSEVDTVLDESLSESLEELVFSDDPVLSMLGDQLVRFSFINKGMAFQRGSYAKLLTPAILEKFNIPDILYQEMNYQNGTEGSNGLTLDLYAQVNYRDFSQPLSIKASQWSTPLSELPAGRNMFTVDETAGDKIGAYILRTSNNNAQNPEYYNPDTTAVLYKRSAPQENANGEVVYTFTPMQKLGIPGKLVELSGSSSIHTNTSPQKNLSKVEYGEAENVATTEDKVTALQNNFAAAGIDVEVRLDENLQENANVETVNGKPVVTLNPNKTFGDTVIHEFGHVYVDLLGTNNAMVKLGISQLEGTDLWNEVSAAYPELSGEALAKEVLVTAIGREGSKIFNEQRSQSKWQIWLNKFFRAVGNLFGVQPNAARILATEMLNNQMQRSFGGQLSDVRQYQKSKDSDNLTEFMSNKRLQIERLLRKYKSENMPQLAKLAQEWNDADSAENLSLIKDQVNNYIESLDKYITKQEEFLGDPKNFTKSNLDAYYQTLYNYRSALSAFTDFVNLPTDTAPNKETRKIIKSLNKKGTKVIQSIDRIDRVSRETLAKDLGRETTNPEIVKDFMKMFEPSGMHLFDESKTQLLLDSLADTNVTFIALAMKDFKINRALGEEETKRELMAWQDLLKEMQADGVTIESLYEYDAQGNFTGKFIMPTKGFKKLANPAYAKLSNKQKEYSDKIRKTLSRLTAHTNSKFFEYGYIPAVTLNEKTYWDQVKKAGASIKNRVERFKNKVDSGAVGEESDLANEELSNVIVDSAGNIVEMLHLPYMQRVDQIEMPKFINIDPDTDYSPSELAEIKKHNNEVAIERKKIQNQNLIAHGKAVDSDLSSSMEKFIYHAVRHKYRKEMEGKMLLVREQLRKMDIVQDPKKVDKLAMLFSKDNDPKKNRPTQKGEQSNILKHYDKWLTMVFYDHFEADEGETLKKITDGLRDYSSVVGIGLNVFSAINNKTYGEMQTAIEAASGEFFTVKDWKNAKVDYNKNILNMYSDRASIKSDNKIVAITKKFDILQTTDELSGREYNNPVMRKIMWAKNAVYAMQHAGEHSMQNQVLLAMLRKEKAIVGGKEVSLMDALELKNGYIEIKDGAKNAKGEALTSRDLAKFKNKVLSVNQYLHGIYNKEDAGTLQHYAMGRLIIQFRKWARPGWNKRFGSKFGKSTWNEIRETSDEGSYTTGAKFAKELMRSAINMDFNAKAQWSSLDEAQKANMRRVMMEIAMMGIVGTLAMLAAGAAEDDDDSKVLATAAYMLDRSRTELMTYLPVYGWFNEGKKLMNSPVASFRQVESLSKIMLHTVTYPFVSDEDRFYQGGMYRGERKLGIWVKQMLPGVSIYQRWKFIERQTAYFKLFGF